MYYGMSLGRIGIDFRQAVTYIFEDAVGDVVEGIIIAGVNNFIKFAQDSKLENIKKKVTIYDEGFSVSGSFGSLQTILPPSSLLQYPPLAGLLNSYLSAFNQLRVLPLIGLIDRVVLFTKKSLEKIIETLENISSLISEKEQKDEYNNCLYMFSEVLVVDIIKGLKLVYSQGSNAGAKVNLQELVDRLINKKELCKPIEKFVNTILFDKMKEDDLLQKNV
ncbi:conserved oligomeric Golgi complex component [Lobulomyces angularis]|nr:conserved oligomeric Golgi complex component [Lobulomyces angularis]